MSASPASPATKRAALAVIAAALLRTEPAGAESAASGEVRAAA